MRFLAVLMAFFMALNVGATEVPQSNNKGEAMSLEIYQEMLNPTTYTDGTMEMVKPGVLLAQAEDEGGVTPQDVAEIIEEKVQPFIDEAVRQLENAPPKGSSPITWVNYVLMAVMSFVGIIVGIFFSGSKRNLRLD